MADKKITSLQAQTQMKEGDLLLTVDDPTGGSPVNKKVTIKNLFANGYTSNVGSSDSSGISGIKVKVSQQGTAATTTHKGAEFTASANVTSENTNQATSYASALVGVHGVSEVKTANSIVSGVVSGIFAETRINPTVNASAITSPTAGVYALSAVLADETNPRTVNATAYIMVGDSGANGSSVTADYLIDLFPAGYRGGISSAQSIGPVQLNQTASTANGTIKIRFNGSTKYIQLHDASA